MSLASWGRLLWRLIFIGLLICNVVTIVDGKVLWGGFSFFWTTFWWWRFEIVLKRIQVPVQSGTGGS